MTEAPRNEPLAGEPAGPSPALAATHLRVLIANEREDRIALVTTLVARLGHTVIAGSTDVRDVGPRPHEDGELPRHTQRMRRIYQARRDAFVTILRQRLGQVLSFEVPPGGMSLWARVADGIDAERWCVAGAARGVGFMTGRSYVLPHDSRALHRWRGHLRLGYARYQPAQLEEAVDRMVVALR